jgi:hypothetical protein
MAREIHEREDLLRDAVALVPRIALRVVIGGKPCEVFAGFRGESLSLYFDGDPVYHFNAAGELRRAFVADQLVKAERRQLVFMRRQQSENETALERQPNDAVAEQSLLAGLQRRLEQLRVAIANNQYEVVGEAPNSGEGLPRLAAWLNAHPNTKIAASPRVT